MRRWYSVIGRKLKVRSLKLNLEPGIGPAVLRSMILQSNNVKPTFAIGSVGKARNAKPGMNSDQQKGIAKIIATKLFAMYDQESF